MYTPQRNRDQSAEHTAARRHRWLSHQTQTTFCRAVEFTASVPPSQKRAANSARPPHSTDEGGRAWQQPAPGPASTQLDAKRHFSKRHLKTHAGCVLLTGELLQLRLQLQDRGGRRRLEGEGLPRERADKELHFQNTKGASSSLEPTIIVMNCAKASGVCHAWGRQPRCDRRATVQTAPERRRERVSRWEDIL